jgi:lipopolysaccharide transport system ATP-binding protein
MGKPILEITNVSKQYRLGYVGTGSLGHDIHRWWCNIRGKEDPYLKIGEENNRTQVGTSEYVWALRDINLQVQQGEVLGIIGANGAGKSTLLKILSRVTGPTTGKITARGRIASLLEVGTGFHGELTGRENIYLNGAILGMTKKEITSKLDEIIDFSGCERYIDTPVKRYSSGMYVRLAFAVAAHLEPEILIVDEVLAVGDAEFQKKAIGKMKDISSGQGRTVLFVSHNMDSIERLCTRSILMQNGRIINDGNTKEVISNYLIDSKNLLAYYNFQNENFEKMPFILHKINCHDENFQETNIFDITKKIGVTVEFSSKNENEIFIPAINVTNEYGIDIFHSHDVESEFYNKVRPKGIFITTVWIPENLLAEGYYTIGLGFLQHLPFKVYYHNRELIQFRVIDYIKGNSARGFYNAEFPGILRPKLQWETKLK